MVLDNQKLHLTKKMDRLKLSKGIIAIGYGGTIDTKNQTKISLVLANKLAKKEKVVFLNWNNYSRKLEKMITKLDIIKNEKLEINTSIDYFGLSSFLNITELIEQRGFTTIFIDNIFSYTLNELKSFEERNLLIKSFRFITERYSIRIVFNIKIESDVFYNSYIADENTAELGYFNWCRKIITDCEQVIAIQNIEGCVNGETDEQYQQNTFKIFDLKNENDETKNYLIKL